MRGLQEGPAAEGAGLDTTVKELEAALHSQRAGLEARLAAATAELAEVRPRPLLY